MEACDVLIVGGGPSGSSLAWGLRQSGLEVTLLDKQPFPRSKVCAGWITPAVLEALQIDSADYAAAHTLQPIHSFQVSILGGAAIRIDYDAQPVSYGIRRTEFDDYLLRRCGAVLRLSEPFQGMEQQNGGWLINGEIHAKLVVGAGGHFCPVARQFGARPGRSETTVTAQEIEFPMTPEQAGLCRVEASVPELFFCRDMQGYGWVFRKGDYLNIGLGRENGHRLSEQVQAFCRYLNESGRVPFALIERFNGHAYLLYKHAVRPLFEDNILLVGDAAGLAYTQSGEGIRPAVESGLLAARIIRAAQGDYRRARLAGYADLISERFGRRPAGNGSPGWFPSGFKGVIGAALLKRHWFIRRVVMDRWFLHLQQPPLVS